MPSRNTALLLLATATLLPAADRPDGLYAIFNTSLGTITARLYEKETPGAVANFVALAQGTKPFRHPKTGAMVKLPLYNNITFHRIVRGEMIQAGDPTGVGNHDCGVRLQDEILPGLRFDGPGRLAMANTGELNTGGCQFFITDNAMPTWNGKYTIFGTVIEGREVITKLNHVPLKGDRPVDPPKLLSVLISRIGPEPELKRKKK